MTDLVSGVLTRISELEAKAREAKAQARTGEWVAVVNAGDGDCSVETRKGAVVVAADGLFEVGPHIAANDPNAILRLCRAHRQIVERHQPANPDAKPEEGLPGWPDRPWLICKTCGSGETNEYPVTWPCETLLDLAVGLGVVEEGRNGE